MPSWIRSGSLNSQFTSSTKIKIFKSDVILVLLYGCKTWRMTQTEEKKLDAFLHKSLRRIFKIHRPMPVRNKEIRRRGNIASISEQVAGRWTWLGHILRMDQHSDPCIALTWLPEGKRARGRPCETWRRTLERELRERGLRSWTEPATVVGDKMAWRQGGSSTILH